VQHLAYPFFRGHTAVCWIHWTNFGHWTDNTAFKWHGMYHTLINKMHFMLELESGQLCLFGLE